MIEFSARPHDTVASLMLQIAQQDGTPNNQQELYCMVGDTAIKLQKGQPVSVAMAAEQPEQPISLMLVVSDQPLKWNTERHGTNCKFTNNNSSVQVTALKGRCGAIGLASFSAGECSFGFTGSAIKEGQGFVGVAVQNALTADCNALGEWAYRLDLYSGNKKAPGKETSASNYQTYHKGRVHGDCLGE
jgi:hypothetical protein